MYEVFSPGDVINFSVLRDNLEFLKKSSSKLKDKAKEVTEDILS
jgi:hypothetical protein